MLLIRYRRISAWFLGVAFAITLFDQMTAPKPLLSEFVMTTAALLVMIRIVKLPVLLAIESKFWDMKGAARTTFELEAAILIPAIFALAGVATLIHQGYFSGDVVPFLELAAINLAQLALVVVIALLASVGAGILVRLVRMLI